MKCHNSRTDPFTADAGVGLAAGLGDTGLNVGKYAAQRYLNWEEENPWKGAGLRFAGATGLGYLGIDQDSMSLPHLPKDPVELDESLLDTAKAAIENTPDSAETSENGGEPSQPNANTPSYSGGDQNAPVYFCPNQ